MTSFATQLIQWQKLHGRHQLPWQGTCDPYAIWLSEIMLQQTQVNTVIPYYQRFIACYPNITSLAQAPLDEVLALWSGLGYYARARHLHQAANIIVQDFQGHFPIEIDTIQSLPGIGRSTAAAISVFAYGQYHAILDGNVKRVFARYFGVERFPGEREIKDLLWKKAEELLPKSKKPEPIKTYTQALMDLGATICIRHHPHCTDCPIQQRCFAFKHHRQDELPTPKPRKIPPRKAITALILIRQNNILLIKRPSSGIWGGLWSFPEMQIGENVHDYCTNHFDINVKSVMDLPILNHQFTHFKLDIHPQVCTVLSDSQFKPGQELWIAPDKALHQAIPTPTRTLLEQHFIFNTNIQEEIQSKEKHHE